MREFKFRVWDRVDYMSTPFTLSEMNNNVEFTNDCPVMQYTGLKDKNGKEIYEGDVLKTISAGFLKYRKVFWDESGAVFMTKNIFFEDDILFGFGWLGENSIIEVIGNIYENPELLKK